jgi:soluble lytic murein transglycosylase
MQVMPSTQEWIAEQVAEHIPPGDAFTPQASIRMGAWLLRFLLDYFDGDLELALAAYNGGAGSVEGWQADPLVSDRDDLLRWIGFGETREYLGHVLLNYRVYHALYASGGNAQ